MRIKTPIVLVSLLSISLMSNCASTGEPAHTDKRWQEIYQPANTDPAAPAGAATSVDTAMVAEQMDDALKAENSNPAEESSQKTKLTRIKILKSVLTESKRKVQ